MFSENSNEDLDLVGKRKKREVIFLKSWLDDEPGLISWLSKSDNDVERPAFCKICCVSIKTYSKSDLFKHAQSKIHLKSLENASEENTVEFQENVFSSEKLNRDVQELELKCSIFFAKHNISIKIIDEFVPFIKELCKKPEAVNKINLRRNKCTKLLTKVLSVCELEKVLNILQSTKFSVLIDESTDCSNSKILCVAAQYINPDDGKLLIHLLTLIELDSRSCIAENLFKSFERFFTENNIPLSNILSLACDNASVMVGCNKSFVKLLKDRVPNLILINCICHSSALAAKKSVETIPKECEDLIRCTSTYFSSSAKRSAELKDFQAFYNVPENRILKLSGTRWLALQHCIQRILDNWEPLKSYFFLETVENNKFSVIEKKANSAQYILNLINNDSIYAYLLFLNYVLVFFNKFNANFQTKSVLVHKFSECCRNILLQISQNFLRNTALEKIYEKDYELTDTDIKPLDDVYLGPNCESLLQKIPTDRVVQIRETCLKFYKTSVKEIKARFFTNDILFNKLKFLEPIIALNGDREIINKEDLTLLCYTYFSLKNIKLSQLFNEWDSLPSSFDINVLESYKCLPVHEFWKIINTTRNTETNNLKFNNLKLLSEAALSLPHSNAEPERIFSIVNNVKTLKRNRIKINLLQSICFIKSYFAACNINELNFSATERHLEMYKLYTLKKKKK